MSNLLKTINKFNGNICFVGATDFGDYIFECDRDGILTYASSTKLITDVCLNNGNSYVVAFSNNYIGKYSLGILNETYLLTPVSNVDKIAKDNTGNIYILNRVTNQLFKYNNGVLWTINLPDYTLKSVSDISLRESDSSILYYNSTNIHLIRNDGILINSLPINGSGTIKVLDSNVSNKAFYMRTRTIDASDIEQSSSSSSSSSYILNWSSSSSLSSDSSSSSSTEFRSSSSSSMNTVYASGFTTDIYSNGTYYYNGIINGKPSYKHVSENRLISFNNYYGGTSFEITPAHPGGYTYVIYTNISNPLNPDGDYATCPDNSTCSGGVLEGVVIQ